MRLKNIVLLLAAGFCTGAVTISSLSQFAARSTAVGGEILFVPMVLLLVWLGWMLRGEIKKVVKVRRCKNGSPRRK